MNKLILVEGIPGSGKTTLSRKISQYLSESAKTKIYNEGEIHPADLAWCACIPLEDFDKIVKEYPQYQDGMKANMYIEDGHAIVAYIQFPIEDKDFFKLMESYEVYDNRVGYEAFKKQHITKWKKFSKNAEESDEIHVFECAYLQNHINELLLFHNMSYSEIEKYMLALLDTVKNLNPVMFYLTQPSVNETIRRVSDVRVNKNGEKVWMNRVIEYIASCPYGIQNNLKGFDGMVKFFEARREIELKLINKLPIEAYIIDNPNNNWDHVWEDIKQKLALYF